jgi:hypothetical protein
VYKLLDLTVEAYPDGRLEAAWALNASASKVKSRSRSASQLTKEDPTLGSTFTPCLTRAYLPDQGWSDVEVVQSKVERT